MFSGGIGQIDHTHISKGKLDIGMLVVKIGGPTYRIGMGGGAVSSMVRGQNDAKLDFNAVQRGDAKMAHKLYCIVRACIEMGENNPIISIHDQGARGNCNVVKDIIYPKGAEIDIRAVVVGDHTMSVLEIWAAEYQEQDAILVNPESCDILHSICETERVSMAVIGIIIGQGRVVLVDSIAIQKCHEKGVLPPPTVVDLEFDKVLGNMPQKCFEFHRVTDTREPLDIASGTTVRDCLKRVLRLPSVCSKRFLTSKVDKCVTGLVAQQQTVRLLQITLSDVAVIAQSYSDFIGGACASDWGKDCLSMAAHAGGEVIKAPGNIVISVYVTCPNITKIVTPDLKLDDDGLLLHIDLARGKHRLGGFALAQVFDQIGDECLDLEDVTYLKRVFECTQDLIGDELISAGHDISDGGPLVCALEMAFAGNFGMALDLTSRGMDIFNTLFVEELGLIVEVSNMNLDIVMRKLNSEGIHVDLIGQVTTKPTITLKVDGVTHVNEKRLNLEKKCIIFNM